jgi:Holliday junction resolvase RusA-like endonuclease
VRGDELFRVAIPGEPYPWPRSRLNRQGKLYLPKSYVAARDLVAMHLNAASSKQAGVKEPLADWDFRVVLGCFRKGKRRADVDNLAKTVLDAGTSVVWVDDSQVRSLTVEVSYGDPEPRTEVIVYRLAPQ